jgi:hypothetical protein
VTDKSTEHHRDNIVDPLSESEILDVAFTTEVPDKGTKLGISKLHSTKGHLDMTRFMIHSHNYQNLVHSK